jgi:RNA polymerase sigma-70 factor (ECF subfamily)
MVSNRILNLNSVVSSNEPTDRTGAAAGRWFPTTHWSLVMAAGHASSTQSQEALEKLCRVYWPALYAYVRRQGHGPQDSEDLTQEFFARFLEKDYLKRADRERGKFRTFLLTSLKHFLVNEWKKNQAVKRGAGLVVACDFHAAEAGYAAAGSAALNPEELFERRWAEAMLEQAVSRLRKEYSAFGKLAVFDALKDMLLGERSEIPYAELAGQLNMSEGAIKVAVHRLRHRYQEVLHAEVAQTVESPTEVEAELRHIVTVLRD